MERTQRHAGACDPPAYPPFSMEAAIAQQAKTLAEAACYRPVPTLHEILRKRLEQVYEEIQRIEATLALLDHDPDPEKIIGLLWK